MVLACFDSIEVMTSERRTSACSRRRGAPRLIRRVRLLGKSESMNAQEAAQRFRAAAIAKGTGAGADDRTLHAEMGAAVSFLDEAGEIGGSMLRDLLRDPSPLVRLWVGAELLSRGETAASSVLEEISREPGLVGFTAQKTLEVYGRGELKSPFRRPAT